MYKKYKGNIKQLNSELKMIICKRIQKFLLYKKNAQMVVLEYTF